MAQLFTAHLSAGLCVVPLHHGVPQTQWSNYFDVLPTDKEAAKWDSLGHKEYALVCGKVSGIIALDIDTDSGADVYYTLAGATPVRKLGSKGFTAFYRYNGERSHTWGGVVELLSDKRLTTIPPSPHRKTRKPYVWMDGVGLLDIESGALPAINPDLFTFLDIKFPKQKQRVMSAPVSYDDKVDLTDAAEMLEYVSSDCSRDEWIEIGMALRDEYGDAACNLWHSWSAKAGSRYNHNAAQASWRSFGNTGVTIGTLVYRAKQGGWLPRPVIDEGFSVDISYIFDAPKPPKAPKPVVVSGLVGAIADWITETAIRPQPVLSLAAAIVFVGMLKGHRVRGRTNLRTNIMALSMAPTAAGKEHPQQCIDRIAEAVGLGKHMMGRPTSGTGLLTGINKCGGVSLLSIDEMGRFMGNISLKNSGGYQREITDYMVELFSAANRTFRGRQYANEKQNPQVILDQPHLCCLGSTVPERMKDACSGKEIIDGFLNRWLVFSSADRPEKQRGVKYAPPPASLIDRINAWMAANPVQADNYGTPTPNEVTLTKEAWEVLVGFDDAMTKKLDSEPYPLNQLYARAPEHAEKLAMVLCDGDVVGISEIEAAIAIVEQSNLQIAAFAGSITDNQHEADVLFVLDVIKRWPDISRNQLTHMTRKLTQRQRAEILSQLLESGEVKATENGKRVSFRLA